MMKRIIYTLFSAFTFQFIIGQPNIDNLLHNISSSKNDTVKLSLLNNLIELYGETHPDRVLFYGEKALAIARKLNFKLEEAYALGEMGYALLNTGNYPKSLQTFLLAIAISEDPESEKKLLSSKYFVTKEVVDRDNSAHIQRIDRLARNYQYVGVLYSNTNNYEKALFYNEKGKLLAKQTGNTRLLVTADLIAGRIYLTLNKPDSALIREQQAYDQALQIGYKRYLGSILLNLGRIYLAQGSKQLAGEYFRRALAASKKQNYVRGIVACNLLLADFYRQSANSDSGFHYIINALQAAKNLDAPDLLLRSYTSLAEYYKDAAKNDSAVKYQSLIIKLNDSLFNSKQAQQFQNIDFDEEQRLQQIEAAESAYQVRLRMYVLIAGLATFLLLAIILWRNNNQRKKANLLLCRQKEELESTLIKLKATQKQLVQSEKMASLGELTAGIAHEIQNPLNFVNNFSDINAELVNELKNELNTGNKEEAVAIADAIKENEQKINHHGKRADAIVKGMLQHSRNSTGQKEPTDINALADEYLRLSYHGLRAKDKQFNAVIETDFDQGIEKINIIPQDIGRVLLNLYNNAFYSVTEKKKQAGEDYQPTVSVSTKKSGNKILIMVKDNGIGISQKILDKIFQPFFTTKPAGQGTGLGLSLSYDIIKAHGGEIKVETKEARLNDEVGQGESIVFIIQLPIIMNTL